MNKILILSLTIFSLSASAAEVCSVSLYKGVFDSINCLGTGVKIEKNADDLKVIKTMTEAGYDLKTETGYSSEVPFNSFKFVKH